MSNLKKLDELYEMAEDEDIGVYHANLRSDVTGTISIHDEGFDIIINARLDKKEELSAFSHEMGHVKNGLCTKIATRFTQNLYEGRANNWAATFRITYHEYRRMLKNTYINNDFEAAEELGVDPETYRLARRRYELEGLPIRRCELFPEF